MEKLIVPDSDSVPHHKYPSKLKNHKKLRKPCSWIVTRNTRLHKSWTTTRFFRVTFLGTLSDLFRGKLTSIVGDLNDTWKKLAGGCLFSFPTSINEPSPRFGIVCSINLQQNTTVGWNSPRVQILLSRFFTNTLNYHAILEVVASLHLRFSMAAFITLFDSYPMVL